MEWLPKLYDTLDSVAFELRMRWAGYGGQQLRMLAMLVEAENLRRTIEVAPLTIDGLQQRDARTKPIDEHPL